jgi:hypothetical protein
MPIICLDARLRQFCETFRTRFNHPQFKYLVTVLLALMLCQETHTLTVLLRPPTGWACSVPRCASWRSAIRTSSRRT